MVPNDLAVFSDFLFVKHRLLVWKDIEALLIALGAEIDGGCGSHHESCKMLALIYNDLIAFKKRI